MVVRRPSSGSTIGAVANLCYEVSGTSREPDVVFEVTLLADGAVKSGPLRVRGGVGAGSARVEFGDVPAGRYQFRVQLEINGERLSGAVVTIPVSLAREAAATSCP